MNWTSEELFGAISEVEDVLQSTLPAADVPSEEREVIEELETAAEALADLDEVLGVLVFRNTAAAQVVLQDGTSLLVINNRPFEGPEPGSTPPLGDDLSSAQARSESKRAGAPVTSSRPQRIGPPSSGDAVALAIDGGDEMAGEVADMLSDAGYELRSVGGSLDDMRSYKNLGALYLDTHGASFRPAAAVVGDDGVRRATFPLSLPTRFALQTTTVADRSRLAALRDELLAGDVLVAFTNAEGQPLAAKLAITESFIEKNWSFEDGVVMIHACFSGSAAFNSDGVCYGDCDADQLSWDPAPVQQAVLSAGADLMVGFDNLTNAYLARESIRFFYDRMLGADTHQRMDPPIRPFNGSDVNFAMAQEDLLSYRFTKRDGPLGRLLGEGHEVNLTFHGSAQDAALAPSIERFEVIDDADRPLGQMVLHGMFGETAGEVEVDGRSLQIESWSKDRVTALLPFEGFAGDVEVSTPPDRVKSNPVPLTEWRGTMTFSFEPGSGSLRAEAEVDVRFRADIHSYRPAIDAEPMDPTSVVTYISPASEGSTDGSGSFSQFDATVTWTGGEPIEILSKQQIEQGPLQPGSESEFGGRVYLDTNAGKARICVYISGAITSRTQGGGSTTEVRAPVIQPFLQLFDGIDSQSGGLHCLDLAMSSGDYSIPADSRDVTAGDAKFRLEWTSFQTVAPPDDETPA